RRPAARRRNRAWASRAWRPSSGTASERPRVMPRMSRAIRGGPGPPAGCRPSRRASPCRLAAAPRRRQPRSPNRQGRRTAPPYRPAASRLQSTQPDKRELRRFPLVSVDVGPAPVALEDHLAPVTAEHDLELPPPDRRGIAAAHGTRRGLVHEGPRQGVHFYL